MAVVKKSQIMTDFDAGGRQRTCIGTLEAAAADIDVGDEILLAPIPTNARIGRILLFFDDLGTTLTVDVGLHKTDGTIKDQDAYATAVDVATAANTAGLNVRNEAMNIDKLGQRVWEDAGDTVDPGGHYVVSITTAASSTPAAGTISWIIEYTID
jgi:hypothetical protein